MSPKDSTSTKNNTHKNAAGDSSLSIQDQSRDISYGNVLKSESENLYNTSCGVDSRKNTSINEVKKKAQENQILTRGDSSQIPARAESFMEIPSMLNIPGIPVRKGSLVVF